PYRPRPPPLARYATLQFPDGSTRLIGYTEASRGCRHLCRHCPVVPIYEGQFRVVQPEVVLADIGAQVAAGAGHITFGDPDFFNGPTHAMRIVSALRAAHPHVTYDDTIEQLDLVDCVAPIQLAIRLLLPRGSLLLTHDEMRPHVGAFDPATLTYRWTHPDPRVDALHADVNAIVGTRLNADRRSVFDE